MNTLNMIRLAAASGALLLSGCATDMEDAHVVQRMAHDGRCDPADTYADQNISDRGLREYIHGFVAEICRHNSALALTYANTSARLGNPGAQAILKKMGQPVPAADLLDAQNQAAERRAKTTETLLMLLGAGASGYSQSRALEQSHMPVSTSCTTNSAGMVNCVSY